MDVGSWLRKLGLERYGPAFRDNGIDSELLPRLTAEDLKELGVALVGDRRRLLEAITALRAGSSVDVIETPREAPVAPEPAAPARAERAAEVVRARVTGERRHLTVMFCDLVGSTEIAARLDAEEWRDIVAEYHLAVARVVARFGGYVAKNLGDGALVYFGYPQAQENDAERSLRAGLAVVNAVATQSRASTLRNGLDLTA